MNLYTDVRCPHCERSHHYTTPDRDAHTTLRCGCGKKTPITIKPNGVVWYEKEERVTKDELAMERISAAILNVRQVIGSVVEDAESSPYIVPLAQALSALESVREGFRVRANYTLTIPGITND